MGMGFIGLMILLAGMFIADSIEKAGKLIAEALKK